MSRGAGVVQRRLMEILAGTDDHLSTFELAARVYHPGEQGRVGLSDAEVVAVRRALGGLAEQGKIGRIGRIYRAEPGRHFWANIDSVRRHQQRVEAMFGRRRKEAGVAALT